jgi:uncharacterized protein
MRRTVLSSVAFLFCAATMVCAAEVPSLMAAVKSGDAATIRAILKAGANPNAPAPDGLTPLHLAVHLDNFEIVDLLLKAGANPSTLTRYNIAPLTLAAENGNAGMIDRLLEAGADPNTVSEEGQTALMTASMNGKVDAVRALLRKGAKVNLAESFRGQTALMFAAGNGNTKAAEMLIEFGADMKARSKAGFTALLFAVRNNQLDAAKFLLQHGAEVNYALPDGTAALNMAVLNADFDLASMLLDFGANPNQRDPRGMPLHTVVWLHQPGAPPDFAMSGVDPQPPPKPSGRLGHLEIAKKLLDKGADPNARVDWNEPRFTPGGGLAKQPPNIAIGRHYLTYNGATPFYLAARNGDAPMMRVLAAAGADSKLPTRFGVTPLMAAACMDYYEGETAGPFSGVSETERLDAVKLALQLGNDINARTTFGNYPMTGSAEKTLLTYPDNIKEILNLGVGDMRFNGMTALHGSVICNQPSITQYLIDQGAKLDAKNQLGWTPLMVSTGLYIANNRKDFPAAGELIRQAMIAKGIPVQ